MEGCDLYLEQQDSKGIHLSIDLVHEKHGICMNQSLITEWFTSFVYI